MRSTYTRVNTVILSVSSKRRRLEARNFAVILIYTPFTTYEKTSFKELAGRSFTNGFLGPKSFRNFWETGPRAVAQSMVGANHEGKKYRNLFASMVLNAG